MIIANVWLLVRHETIIKVNGCNYHCILKNVNGLILKDFSTTFMCTLCTCDCSNKIATKMVCLTKHEIASKFWRVFKN